jgi:ferredoxin
MKVRVDHKLCDGHAQCVLAAPEVFDLPAGADQAIVLDAEPPEDARPAVEEAAARCPVAAIAVEG